jgi:hypothetical protein
MAEVHVLPGVERRDLMVPLPCAELLQKAIDAGVTDAVIVGRARDGSLYVASASTDVDRDVGRLMRAVEFLTSHTIENDQVIETEPPV